MKEGCYQKGKERIKVGINADINAEEYISEMKAKQGIISMDTERVSLS